MQPTEEDLKKHDAVLQDLRQKAVAYTTVSAIEQIYSKLAEQAEMQIGKTKGVVSETFVQLTSLL